MANKNDHMVEQYLCNRRKNINHLLETRYISIYVVLSFFAQIIIEILADFCNETTYILIGFVTILFMFVSQKYLIKKTTKEVFKMEITPNSYNYSDIIIECANSLSYASPLIVIESFLSDIVLKELLIIKYVFLLIIVFIGILIPVHWKYLKK